MAQEEEDMSPLEKLLERRDPGHTAGLGWARMNAPPWVLLMLVGIMFLVAVDVTLNILLLLGYHERLH